MTNNSKLNGVGVKIKTAKNIKYKIKIKINKKTNSQC